MIPVHQTTWQSCAALLQPTSSLPFSTLPFCTPQHPALPYPIPPHRHPATCPAQPTQKPPCPALPCCNPRPPYIALLCATLLHHPTTTWPPALPCIPHVTLPYPIHHIMWHYPALPKTPYHPGLPCSALPYLSHHNPTHYPTLFCCALPTLPNTKNHNPALPLPLLLPFPGVKLLNLPYPFLTLVRGVPEGMGMEQSIGKGKSA